MHAGMGGFSLVTMHACNVGDSPAVLEAQFLYGSVALPVTISLLFNYVLGSQVESMLSQEIAFNFAV